VSLERGRHPARSTQQLGRDGEAQAARFLEARGYRIVARNVRAGRAEIDLIARRGPLLAFVEVKSRRSERYGGGAEAVDERKQRRIRRGAAAWLAERSIEARGARHIRFDVVLCRTGLETPPVPARSGHERQTFDEVTAPDGTRWQIEHWEDAF
jgi:putative endonuclease